MQKNNYQLGVVSISFRGHTPEEILQAAKAAGLSWVEWGSDVHAPCHDQERLCEIVALQKKYDVRCSSYGTYFRLGETPIEELVHYVRAAQKLGTDILRLWCGGKSGKDMTEEEREALLVECRRAAEIAEANGAILCMECHQNTFTERPDDALWLMRSVDSRHFRMYWQPFQWQDAEQNLKNAEMIGPYAEHIHVFHWKGRERFPLAEAVAEWRSYLEKFSLPRTLLLEFMPNDEIGALAEEARALKTIIGETV
ncbi:MAG: sugar phosphate isomerase/epimerase [Clostridia bacterium]|nr:sugar phosphate isomerase/epimerase [Clostridia bacterium]